MGNLAEVDNTCQKTKLKKKPRKKNELCNHPNQTNRKFSLVYPHYNARSHFKV